MKLIDTFSGIGGFSLAAHRVGWETVLFCENNSARWEDLKRNFPGVPIHPDIKDLTKNKILEYVQQLNTNELILTGGFPCQDISVSGKGRGIRGERSGLWSEFYRIIKALRPRCVLAENSPQITRRGFEQILCDFAEIGYNVEWESFFASEFGYYHKRERTYILAYSNGERWTGILHSIKRNLQKKNSKKNALGEQCNPFDRFTEVYSEPYVFGMDDGVSGRMVIPALEAYGNAIIPDIPEAIFKAIEVNHEKESRHMDS